MNNEFGKSKYETFPIPDSDRMTTSLCMFGGKVRVTVVAQSPVTAQEWDRAVAAVAALKEVVTS
jgi:hypothetical protein